jgi:hypothetical protein
MNIKNFFSFIIFLFLIFCQFIFSEPIKIPIEVSCFSFSIKDFIFKESILQIVVFSLILLISIVFMFGKLTSNPHALLWANSEFFNLIWSVLLIFLIGAALSLSCLFSSFFVHSTFKSFNNPYNPNVLFSTSMHISNLISVAESRVATLLRSALDDNFNSLEIGVFNDGILSPSGSGGLMYQSGRREWSSYKEMLISYYIPLLGSLYFQKLIISNLTDIFLGVMIPAAILLRLIPIFRDVGDFLIAICISVYFFVPLCYTIFIYSYESVFGSSLDIFSKILFLYDPVVGDNLQFIAFLTIQAIFVPNFILLITTTAAMGIYKAIKGFFS